MRTYGNLCKFAHGMTEQRSRLRHPMYKTSLCKDFPLGKCSFGNRCNFAHSLDELRIHTDAQIGITGNMQAGTEDLPQTPPVQQPKQRQKQQQSSPVQQPQLQPQSAQAKKFQKRYKQQQQLQALLQTPITMLPDGRLLSTFTPVTTNMGDSGAPADAMLPLASGLSKAKDSPVASVRAFGELRKYQSMGTLRTTNQLTPNMDSFGAAQQQQYQQQNVPASALALQDMDDHSSPQFTLGQQHYQTPASIHPPAMAHSPIATVVRPSLAAGVSSSTPLANQQSFAAYDAAKQQLPPPSLHHHFQQEQANVARRVASLSQLPSLRTASPQIGQPSSSLAMTGVNSPAGSGAGSGNLLLQNSFQLSNLGPAAAGRGASGFGQNHHYQHHHRRESSFALAPLDIQSSSPLSRENDEGTTPPPPQQQQTAVQPDFNSVLNESDFARLSLSNTPPQQQQQQQQQYLQHPHAAQRRMLTSSVSMQTLPRFKLPVNWGEQPLPNQHHNHHHQQSSMLSLAATSSTSSSSSGPQHAAAAIVGSSSQSSAATLIDSDVWSNTLPLQQPLPPSASSGGISSHLDPVVQSTNKLYESRFFPSAATGGTASSAGFSGAFSLASPAGLGPNVDPLGIYYPTLGNSSPHASRHQHLRRQQSTDDWMLLRQSRAYGSPNISTDGMPSVGTPLGTTNLDNRLSPLDQLRVAAANRKQFNPSMNDSSVYLF
ncbi:hypothetical protein IW140_002429 [Coemansia sp. RSA 1813]|nr:hypothetical protein IW140_002429 [Coemansia sp. RSA 1813]